MQNCLTTLDCVDGKSLHKELGNRCSLFFVMEIHSAFNVAFMHNTGALIHLGHAWKLEGRIRILDARIRGYPAEKFHFAVSEVMDHSIARREQIRMMSVAVILFQASMEAVISLAYKEFEELSSLERPNGFCASWEAALSERSVGTDNLDTYCDEIYRGYRNALVHVGTKKDLETINDMDFARVYTGIRAGWWAHRDLSAACSHPHIHTWEEMCDTYRLPTNV